MSVRRWAIGWSSLANARVGVWGLGVEGGANLRRSRTLTSDVLISDDRPSVDAVDGIEVHRTDRGGLDALMSCDVVVKTPGISRRLRPELDALVDRGVPVVGGTGLWMHDVDRERVVCVTGTKGKSTTVSVMGHLLTGLGRRVFVGGNIGRPPYDPAVEAEVDYFLIETSSFQVCDLADSPPVVAVTSLSPDHLDWHGSVEHYYADKLSLCTQRGARTSIVDGTCAVLRSRAAELGPAPVWITAADADEATWASGLGLLGAHNRLNAAIAKACLVELGVEEAGDDEALAAAAHGFDGLESRLRIVASIDGVDFVDDSLSTNVLPTIAAIESFPGRRVALLVGGHDRGIEYGALGEHLAARAEPTLVLTMPDNGPRIAAALRDVDATIALVECDDLADAVARGFEYARPDGVVLLSPAAPSFGRFRDYRERAEAFVRAAQRLGAAERPC